MNYYEELWNTHFELAKKYYEEHGNLNVPNRYCVGNFSLGRWIRQQILQYQKGKLPEKYVECLSSIGINWNNCRQKNIDNSYEDGFQHLEQYLAENSGKTPPVSFVCSDGYTLGRWLANTKNKYRQGKLKTKYAERFQKLGITLEKI